MMAALQQLMLFYLLTCTGKYAHGSNIIGGQPSQEGSRLYMVSVQNSKGHICGGFLISEDLAVTAAHCYDRNPTSIVLGTHNLKRVNENTMRYSITPCRHPNFEKAQSGDDIMLLKLCGKVQLNDRIKTIGLPSTEMDLKPDTVCSVAGWGFTTTGGGVVDDLHEVDVSVVNMTKCVNMWDLSGSTLPNNVTCAGGSTAKGFCQGDSGGPLVCHGIAVGVASFNYERNCHYPNLPNIYTDVSKYLPWINEILSTKRC